MVITSEGKPVYPTFLAVKLAFNPTTKFGHHFASMPTTLTKDVAHETKDDLRDAFASLIGVDTGVFTDTPPSMAHAFRLFLPATDGGIGFTDPVSPTASQSTWPSSSTAYRHS